MVIKYGFIDFFDFLKKTISTECFVLILIATTLIAASGYLINCYLNSKNPIHYRSPKILAFLGLFTVLGASCGIYVAVQTNKLYNIIIPIFCWILVLSISATIKGRSFVKDLLLSFFLASSCLIIWWVHMPSDISTSDYKIFCQLEIAIISFTILIFNSAVVYFIFLSLKNLQIDKQYNNITIPLVYGSKKSKRIIFVLSTSINVFTIGILYSLLNNINLILLLIGINILHYPFLFKRIVKARSTEDYQYIIKLLLVSFFVITPIFVILTAINLTNAS